MSGHNKWSTIKRKKEKTDQQKGKIFSKLAREIMMAAKIGGSDQVMNARLRLAIIKAKESNMPSDNIKRAVEKGASGADSANLEEILFEIYSSFGVALLVEAVTDNKNRTISNIKSIINKYGANLAAKGAVAYLFDKKGLIIFEPGIGEDAVMEIAAEYNVDDLQTTEDGSIEVTMDPNEFETIKNAFDEKKLAYMDASITMIPKTVAALETLEQAQKITRFIEKIEEDDDVQDVYGNHEIPENILEQLDQ
jgi:YebC/PmpR family DNA-binding regulatory protein